jgi:hypothetical protein
LAASLAIWSRARRAFYLRLLNCGGALTLICRFCSLWALLKLHECLRGLRLLAFLRAREYGRLCSVSLGCHLAAFVPFSCFSLGISLPLSFVCTEGVSYALYASCFVQRTVWIGGGGGGVQVRNDVPMYLFFYGSWTFLPKWHSLCSLPFQGPKKVSISGPTNGPS